MWRGGEEIKAGVGEEVGGEEETKVSEWRCRLVEWERWGHGEGGTGVRVVVEVGVSGLRTAKELE